MDTETCTCGHRVTLAETTLRKGAQTVGCLACNYTGRAKVATPNTNNTPKDPAK